MTNPTSPKFPADIRSPLEALRDALDQAEMLTRWIAIGSPELANNMKAFRDQLPYDLLAQAEEAQASLNRDREDRETEAFYKDEKAMYRPAS